MFDFVTFGSASYDNLLLTEKNALLSSNGGKFAAGKEVSFSVGAKIKINNLLAFIGGGGTNTAFTFSLQGFETAYVGKIGKDDFGGLILKTFQHAHLGLFIREDIHHRTNQSIIFLFPGGERTIFTFRGAASYLTKNDVPWQKLQTKWFYLAPLGERLGRFSEYLIKFAKRNGSKVASNPSLGQLALLRGEMKKSLQLVDVLILNQEEASFLCRVPFQKETQLLKILRSLTKGIIVVTKGAKGSVVLAERTIYRAGAPSIKPLDKTGAGDAFASGFLTGLLRKNSIEYAIQFATANATHCISKFGAKNGLLKKGEKIRLSGIKVKKSSLQ